MRATFHLPIRARDLSGQRFTKLLVLRPVPSTKKSATSTFMWLCRCDCGVEIAVEARMLNAGMAKSCGCFKIESARARARNINLKHGMYLSGEYTVWKSMIRRCTDDGHKNYNNYGGRGIRVCDRWRTFANFFADVGLRPSLKHTIDRYPNQNGNYEAGNVRWALRREQSLNTRKNRIVTAFGVSQPLAAFFERSGTREYDRALYRINTGWSAEDAIRLARGA